MLFKGNSSRLQLLIEKIQSNNKDNNDEQDIDGIFIRYHNIFFIVVTANLQQDALSRELY